MRFKYKAVKFPTCIWMIRINDTYRSLKYLERFVVSSQINRSILTRMVYFDTVYPPEGNNTFNFQVTLSTYNNKSVSSIICWIPQRLSKLILLLRFNSARTIDYAPAVPNSLFGTHELEAVIQMFCYSSGQCAVFSFCSNANKRLW